ncbi:MAG: 30S ribosomal protein S12 methylthiotransferase RimO [Deltaproteobacteria bacterium]|jgi:ribosomal protein S12 methylthiotransferase|nr:30S ribosomal protein S12 methylthiotransferase RimO [Deltaproteobacteria bacterium]
MKIFLLSLGCARNQVDSEIMLGRIKKAGWTIVEDPEHADTIVVNTCSFIEDAADESIEMILELARYKQTGKCKRLVVAGCLPERYREQIAGEMPEVDVFIGTGAFHHIVEAIEGSTYPKGCLLPDPETTSPQENNAPRALSTPHMAYLKVAEGCSQRCTYCIIPKLRGKKRSRPPQDIISEARDLLAGGIKELVLVAQDTTSYGKDLQPPASLSLLVEKLACLPSQDADGWGAWVRVLYGHPESIDDAFIKTVASYPNICSYFDIPIQHVSSSILKKMGRYYNRRTLDRLFDKIRAEVPGASLRTTLIVGFPGESDKDFNALLRFVENTQFDHLGVFLYSDSEDLRSHLLPDHVPAEVAQERYDQLMSCQLDISARNYQQYIGQTLPVLVEEPVEKNLFAGRTPFQAPEVDGMTYIKYGPGQPAPAIGSFSKIKVSDAMEYDLIGDAI